MSARSFRTVRIRIYDEDERLIEPTGYKDEYRIRAAARRETDTLRAQLAEERARAISAETALIRGRS